MRPTFWPGIVATYLPLGALVIGTAVSFDSWFVPAARQITSTVFAASDERKWASILISSPGRTSLGIVRESICGGNRSAKLELRFPGVPPGFGGPLGNGDGAQFS